jgi:hypothetical protein
MTECPAARVKTANSRMLAEHQSCARGADRFRPHDFVSKLVLQHPVLMNPGFVCKRICADDGLVGRHGDPDNRRQRVAGRHEGGRMNPGAMRQRIAPHFDGHHNLFERRVAGTLADAVDRALDLARARLHRR